jgi:3-oxoacyl-[acyl-carrier protein] reductase
MQTNKIALEGRTALITGGAQGIGYALAGRFLESGAKVILWDINRAGAERAAETLASIAGRDRLDIDGVDIADPAAVEQAVARIAEKDGRLDILVNNAALVGANATLVNYPIEEWHRVINVGLNGTFHCCRACVPLMVAQNYGRIVNIASIAGKEGNPNASAYSSMKAGVIALTKSLGKELAGYDIAVNCVTPAVARTPGAMEQAPEHIQYMLSKIPRNRFLELSEVAAMVAWLVSEENSFTTAAVFDLSGGRATY